MLAAPEAYLLGGDVEITGISKHQCCTSLLCCMRIRITGSGAEAPDLQYQQHQHEDQTLPARFQNLLIWGKV